MKNKSKIIYRILLVVFCVGFVVSVSVMVVDWLKQKGAQDRFEQLASQQTQESQTVEESSQDESQETESETETEVDILAQLGITIPEKNLDWEAIWKENEDIYAWIYIPNTVIDYPVLQHPTDDKYYLEYNLDGSKGRPGCIYSEGKYNTKDFSDFNTVLYGHNMRNGTMFADLHLFEDSTFFEENRYIYIYMPEKVLVYDIYGAYATNSKHILATYKTVSDGGKQKYIDHITGIRDMAAHFRKEVSITTTSNLLTLSTCVRGDYNKRYLLQGVLINDEF